MRGYVQSRGPTRNGRRSADPFSKIIPKPKTRAFIVGSTGSGKSTLAAAILEGYKGLHPSHRLFIIDPKRRFVPVEREPEDTRIFPNGVRESNYGSRDCVAVIGRPLPSRWWPTADSDETVWVAQDEDRISALFDWLYRRSDVRRPSLVYCDESFDFIRGTRADPNLRRLLQQGREIGVGVVVVNQRPAWIDLTFLSESDAIIAGALNWADDRERIARAAAAEHLDLEHKLPRYEWWYLDQHNPDRSFHFRLKV